MEVRSVSSASTTPTTPTTATLATPRPAASTSSEEPSQLKSFALGALDLDKPAEGGAAEGAYTAGKWTGAAAKVGALLSLLI